MLEIRDVETINKESLNYPKRKTKKTQILLYDTKRRVEHFINKIKYRLDGNYEDIPHYIITKMGHIYKVLDPDYQSKTFGVKDIDKKQIKIAVENLGWLTKNNITGHFTNWIGDAYRSEAHVESWREKFFWDKYTDTQMGTVVMLCDHLCNEKNIERRVVPSHGFIENIDKFKGIVCKSNFSNIYTDINPSFNFKMFLEDEI